MSQQYYSSLIIYTDGINYMIVFFFLRYPIKINHKLNRYHEMTPDHPGFHVALLCIFITHLDIMLFS